MPRSADVASSTEGPVSSNTVPQSSAKNQAAKQAQIPKPDEGKHLSARSMHPPPSGSMLDSSGPSQMLPDGPSSSGNALLQNGGGNRALIASKELEAATNGSAANSSRKKRSQSGSDSQRIPGASAPPLQLATASGTNSKPTPQQIKAFQSRASAMLARPLTNDPSPESVSTRRSEDKAAVRTPERHPIDRDQKRSELQPNDNRRGQVMPDTVGRTMSLGRAESISPARSTHFLDAPQVEGSKHQPPPRSVSPVKSAMKSPSPRNVSPEILHGRALSDHSDSRSLVSEESSVTGASRKKKSARVSFEDNPVKVGEAAEGGTIPETEPLSPQFRASPREVETSIHEISMAPTPELPSFGSIRARRVEGGADNRAFNNPAPTTQPKPKEPDENSDIEEQVKAVESHDFAEDTLGSREKDVPSLLAPTIAVQPATPRTEESNQFEAQSNTNGDRVFETGENDTNMSDRAPLDVGLDHGLQSDPTISQSFQEEETSSDGDSGDSDVFSDAAEDPSEIEDPAGFASLDAIVESPMGEVTGHTKAFNSSSGEGSPVEATGAASMDPDFGTVPKADDDWNDVRAYWNSLSEQRKAEIESEARMQQPADEDAIEHGGPSEPHSTAAVEATDRPLDNSNSRHKSTAPPTPALKPALKKAEGKSAAERSKPEQIHLRRSMRSSGTMHRSSRSEPPTSASKQLPRPAQKQHRPISTDAQSAQQLAKSIYTSGSKATSGLRDSSDQASKQQPRRASHDSSASDSSFKRKRRDSTSTVGSAKHTMRRSMRSRSPPPVPTSPLASSPVGLTRKSMRSSQQESQERPKSSSSLFGFAKPSKTGKPSRSKRSKSKGSSFGSSSRFQSRFDDSSGDEDDVQHGYSSRFPDSDESGEDAPTGSAAGSSSRKLASLRGIPRKAGREDGDSTDLSDSEEEATAKRSLQMKKGVGPTGRPATPPAQDALSLGKISETPPNGGIVDKAHGSTLDSPLSAGTLRKAGTNATVVSASEPGPKDPTASDTKKSSNRRSFFGFGKKRQSAQPGLQASKWAPTNPSTSTPSSPVATTSAAAQETQTPISPLPSSPRMLATRNSSSKLLRRMSRETPTGEATKGQNSRTNTMGTESPAPQGCIDPHGFPFPPPPIPEEYKGRSGGNDTERPQTSDGLAKTEAGGKTNGMQAKDLNGAERPGMGATRASSVSVPTGMNAGESGLVRDDEDPDANSALPAQVNRQDQAKEKGGDRRVVISERTGKAKKFQGLRRVFRLND